MLTENMSNWSLVSTQYYTTWKTRNLQSFAQGYSFWGQVWLGFSIIFIFSFTSLWSFHHSTIFVWPKLHPIVWQGHQVCDKYSCMKLCASLGILCFLVIGCVPIFQGSTLVGNKLYTLWLIIYLYTCGTQHFWASFWHLATNNIQCKLIQKIIV